MLLGRFRTALTLIIALTLSAAKAHPAEISVHNIPGEDVTFVSFSGEIISGDAEKFDTVVDGLTRATIILESTGGLVREALQIGARIRLRGFSTMVPPDAGCYSTCGLIWLAGVRRYTSQQSWIGFHAAYMEESGQRRESGMANAEIGSYLTHLGLRIEAIRFFTVAGPEQILLLTPERARALGIEVYELRGNNLITPEHAPAIDVYVNRFVSLSWLQSRCHGFFQPRPAAIEHGANTAFEMGNAMVDPALWIKLVFQRVDTMKEESLTRGALLHCIEVEAELRRQRLSTGIDGPGFNCAAAKLPTEHAICSDADLRAKDRAMNSIYLHIRKFADTSLRKRWLAVQRAWLRARNDCGWDKACISQVYDSRLHDLREIDLQS